MSIYQASDPSMAVVGPQYDTPHNAKCLQDLPPELLRHIFEYVVLQGFIFYFWPREYNRQTSWSIRAITARRNPAEELVRYSECTSCGCRLCVDSNMYERSELSKGPRLADNIDCSLFYVNKAIASEARAAFFAGNKFSITINAQAHTPRSLKSPLIFGPLGLPHQLHVLRDLQHIELRIEIDERSSRSVARQRARAQYFVDILKEHAEDHNKKSLLKTLDVRVRGHSTAAEVRREWIDEHMFALEVLSGLQGIGDVTVLGLQTWFARCLSLHLTGRGGPAVSELDWPTKVKRRRMRSNRFQKIEVTTRKHWQPILDWREYALRNKIDLPADVNKYFPPYEK